MNKDGFDLVAFNSMKGGNIYISLWVMLIDKVMKLKSATMLKYFQKAIRKRRKYKSRIVTVKLGHLLWPDVPDFLISIQHVENESGSAWELNS